MKIKILGSAAAECFPALWCECDTCRRARINGGKDIRRRTSYLLDEDTLIDMGPDFAAQLRDFNIDERKIDRIIFTHRHEDHLDPVELLWRRQWYSVVTRRIKIFGGHHVYTRIASLLAELDLGTDIAREMQFDPTILEHGKIVTDGALTILPMNANHDPGHSPFVYILSRGGKKVFVCNDTGRLSEESMALCAGADVDLLILDCTMGFFRPDQEDGHFGVNAALKQIERFRANGAVSGRTKLVVNHFTHNGSGLHADYEAFFNPKGIEVGFDGKEIVF